MSELWDQMRSVLAKADPVRAEYMREDIVIIMAMVLSGMREWEGKEKLPIYRPHALWRLFDSDPEVIAKAVQAYVHDLKPMEDYAEELT